MIASLAAAGVSTLVPRRMSGADGARLASRFMSPEERLRDSKALLAYFSRIAPALLRKQEGFLRFPSISPSLPGKRYSTNLWDWDTLWTARGLFRLAKLNGDRRLEAQIVDHARGSLLNFLDHQSAEGRIPMLISVHDADPLGCLAPAPRPNPKNQAKPVLAQLALLVADECGETRWLSPHFDRLLKFHESWRLNNESRTGLLVWGDDVAIGNDNDPATFGRPFFSSANLLLNTLYYQDLVAAAELARRLQRADSAESLARDADKLGANLLKYCWDPRDRFFYTVDTQCVDRRAELIKFKRGMAMSWNCLPLKIQSFTGFLPLWCGLATREQAAALVAANYRADDRFRAAWGVRSLSSQESMYSLVFSSNPSDWLGPVWIIVNYLAWAGLKRFGYADEAQELADKTLRLLASDLERHGSLNEYYHPDTGAALSHAGFVDWNLLVLEMV